MVYIAHGRTLAKTEKPLIKDQIEAWHYAPAIRSLDSALEYEQAQSERVFIRALILGKDTNISEWLKRTMIMRQTQFQIVQ